MYTLRIFREVDAVDRTQIYLGDSYVVKDAEEEDKKIGIKLRVYGNWDSCTKEGLAVYEVDHAFIMTQLGGTFETLNRPKPDNSDRPMEVDNKPVIKEGRYHCDNCGGIIKLHFIDDLAQCPHCNFDFGFHFTEN